MADRQATLEAVVPPNGDGVLRILVMRPGAAAGSQDLHLVSMDATGGPPSEQLLVADIDGLAGFGCVDMVAPCHLIERNGLLWVYKATGGNGNNGVVLVNPFTGIKVDYPYLPAASPSGQRRFFYNPTAGTATLYDPDGNAMMLDVALAASVPAGFGDPVRFIGEDLYYVTPQGDLLDLPLSGVPEQLATGVAGFAGAETTNGVVLLLARPTSDPRVPACTVRDPLTGAETPLPFTTPTPFFVSPDGQWLLDNADVYRTGHLALFNYRSGAQQSVPVSMPPGSSVDTNPAWRPGTSQLWVMTAPSSTPTLSIVTLGGSTTSVQGVTHAALGNPGQAGGSWFTDDGAHWFCTPSPPDANPAVIQVGSADDPTGPRFDITPPQTSIYKTWTLANDRLLTAVYTDSQPRSDVFAVDLQTGESVQLAERGRIAAVGQTRFVGMFHYDTDYRGDLTTVELDSGRQTILAPEFAVAAFVEPHGADLAAPGTRGGLPVPGPDGFALRRHLGREFPLSGLAALARAALIDLVTEIAQCRHQGLTNGPTFAEETARLIDVGAGRARCRDAGLPAPWRAPRGRQVVADWQATLEAIVPPNGDGVLRILILKPGTAAGSQDLYLVSVDDSGRPPFESSWSRTPTPRMTSGASTWWRPAASSRRMGRSWSTRRTGAVKVDPFTGAQSPFQFVGPASASGQRSFMVHPGGGTLYEPDGSTVAVDLLPPPTGGLGYYTNYGSPYAFFGEDFYYVSSQAVLIRLPPFGAPEQVATGVAGFQGAQTPDGLLLILVRVTSDPSVQALSVRDPLTGVETVLPFSSGDISISPDGQWLLHVDISSGSFTFFDSHSHTQQVVEVPGLGAYLFIQQAWRPGTSQVWFTAGSYGTTPTVWIVSPGASPISVPGVSLTPVGNAGSGWWQNLFTADGAHWFSSPSPPDDPTPMIQVGRADDPTGPRFDLIPEGTQLFNAWLLADGRMLTAVYTDFAPRSDVFAVDLDNGERVQLAERGRVAAVGKTRFVGMFHFDPNYRGDLTTVEVDSGRQTILAPEFAVTAFVEPQGDDLVPPGARVVYQFQARTDSPYDGIWVVNSP